MKKNPLLFFTDIFRKYSTFRLKIFKRFLFILGVSLFLGCYSLITTGCYGTRHLMMPTQEGSYVGRNIRIVLKSGKKIALEKFTVSFKKGIITGKSWKGQDVTIKMEDIEYALPNY